MLLGAFSLAGYVLDIETRSVRRFDRPTQRHVPWLVER